MENLTPEQVAHFVYWLSESHDMRGVKAAWTPEKRLHYIQTMLIPTFFSKYPGGKLTGWANS